jgi:hypothetical protein
MLFHSHRRLAGTLVLSGVALLAACTDRATTPVAPPSGTDQDMTERIVTMGFRRDMIVDEGDHFRVEGDVIIEKRNLTGPRLDQARTPVRGPAYQWHTTNLVSQANMARGLRVNLSGISGNSAWTNAVRSALNNYSTPQGNKIHISEGTPADITFSFGTLPAGVIAQASFPASGLPGTTVTISTAYASSLSSSQKRWAMVHEIGHTIGYRHSNWQANGESSTPFGAIQVPGTPSSDLGSVMQAVLPSGSWSGFNSYDVLTNQYAYPAPAPSMTSQGYNASNHPTFTWSSVPDANVYRLYYFWYGEYWEYDPSFPEGGYYIWMWFYTDLGTTTGTSYTDGYTTRTGNSACQGHYEVVPVYSSGKAGSGVASADYDVC